MRPRVLIYRSDWLNPTEGFVADHAAYLARYAPVTLGLRKPPGALNLPPDHWACGTPDPSPIARYRFRAFGAGASVDDIDLIHAHFATDALDMLPLAKRLRVPLLVTLHGYDVSIARRPSWHGDGLHWRWKGRRLMRQARLFLPVSHWLRGTAEAAGFPPGKLHLHHLGTPIPPVTENVRSGVLFVGRLTAPKGIHDLIAALASPQLASFSPELSVIGDGPERAEAQKQAERLGLTARFFGTLPPAEAREAMARARLLVLPARREPFGLVLIEAQARGTPAIAWAEAGPCEATDLLVAPGDIGALAARIAHLLANANAWQDATRKAREFVADRFDIVARSAALEALYDRVLAQ